jgi:PAS domain S-box-containing protein
VRGRELVLDRVFEEASDPVFVIDPSEDRILAANRAASEMLGYQREELLATPVSHIHPAELPQLREFLERAMQDGQASTIALTCRTKSGEFLPAEMTLLPFAWGERVHVLGLVRDRSEHRGPELGD